MKATKVFSELLGALSRTIAIIFSWLDIIFDWTNEVKEMSDDALIRYKREREVENQIEDANLEKELARKLKEAGITVEPTS